MSAVPREIIEVLAAAEVLHDADSVAATCDRLANELAQRINGRDAVLLTVMQGGLFLAAELFKRLQTPFQMDYLHATRYLGGTSGGEIVWKVAPRLDLSERVVVVIDDILDEGYTLSAIQAELRRQHPEELLTVVLVDKQHDRRAPGAHADLVGLKTPDRYLFGCGMDYKNYLRQYPAIYAVAGT